MDLKLSEYYKSMVKQRRLRSSRTDKGVFDDNSGIISPYKKHMLCVLL